MNIILEIGLIAFGAYGILISKRVARQQLDHSRKWFGRDYGEGKNYEAQWRIFNIIIFSLFIIAGVLAMLDILHWKGEVR